jgi:Na+-translocating ferredoxin:NAD+ oxidoreductase subunit D
MNYSTGFYPHIRTSETVQSLTWTAVLSLLPAAAAQLFLFPSKGFLFLFLLFSVSLHEESVSLLTRNKGKQKYRDFKNGTVLLYLLLFFMMLPDGTSAAAASATFFCALMLSRSIFGGQGSETFHPVMAGLLLLRLLFQAALPGSSQSETWTAWITPGLLMLGGFFVILRKAVRPLIPAVFFLALFPSIYFFNLSVHSPSVSLWLLSGFFIAADPVTTPLRYSRHVMSGICAGVTAALLEKAGLDTGTACAIALLSANAMTPWLDAAWSFPSLGTARG